MDPEVALEFPDSIKRSNVHEFSPSKNNCDEELFLADLAFKGKRKKKSVKDKKKKVKNGIMFKWMSMKNRRQNECDKVDDDIHVIPNFFDEDNPYKEAKCS